MALVDHARKEIWLKIVYYGPGLGGKTAHLKYIYYKTAPHKKGKMILLSSDEDRTLFFDFLPVRQGEVAGYSLNFSLYAVPGQIVYDTARRVVLQGVDGIVMVYDSQASRLDSNLESLQDLEANLAKNRRSLDDVPLVVAYNKGDLLDAMRVEDLDARLNPGCRFKSFETAAPYGRNVISVLQTLTKLVIKGLSGKITAQDVAPATPRGELVLSFSTGHLYLGQWNPVEFEITASDSPESALRIQFLEAEEYALQSMNLANSFLLEPGETSCSGMFWVRPRVMEDLSLACRVGDEERVRTLAVDPAILYETDPRFEGLTTAAVMYVDAPSVGDTHPYAMVMLENLKILLLTAIGADGKINRVIDDAFLVVFRSPSVAVLAARRLQRLVGERGSIYGERGGGVRIGIEVGELPLPDWEAQHEREIDGRYVARAARFCRLAREGEILMSPLVDELTRSNLAETGIVTFRTTVALDELGPQDVVYVS